MLFGGGGQSAPPVEQQQQAPAQQQQGYQQSVSCEVQAKGKSTLFERIFC
jgi:hypothetical protein